MKYQIICILNPLIIGFLHHRKTEKPEDIWYTFMTYHFGLHKIELLQYATH